MLRGLLLILAIAAPAGAGEQADAAEEKDEPRSTAT